MTGLIAGAILLIVGSAVALIFGWIGSNETLIWASIGGSVGAAICLALAYGRSKLETSRPRRRPAALATPTPAHPAEPEEAPPASSVSQDTQAIEAIDAGDEVLADDSGKRFHKPGCPQARPSAERLPRDEAKRRGLEPCRVCRP